MMAEEQAQPEPGYYWVRSRKNGELSIVQVTTTNLSGIEWPVALHHGWEVADDIETAIQEFDFLARIETPEFPS
jgi:hypothetical protein